MAIAVFTLLAARPIAVFVALAGTRQVDTAGKAFMAWFGPKGVATMTFALFVLGSTVPDGERIAAIAAVTVFISIIAHSLTDQPGRGVDRAPGGQDGPAGTGRRRAIISG